MQKKHQKILTSILDLQGKKNLKLGIESKVLKLFTIIHKNLQLTSDLVVKDWMLSIRTSQEVLFSLPLFSFVLKISASNKAR
jgi:hypothetical protein